MACASCSPMEKDMTGITLGVRPAAAICLKKATLESPFSVLKMMRSEEHTSELQSLMRISYAVFCLKKKITSKSQEPTITHLITIHLVTSHIQRFTYIIYNNLII